MRDRPVGHELLAVAASTFREQILPSLPSEQRYPALMILNAMAIAGRQSQEGDGPLHDECDVLEVVLDHTPQATDLQGRLGELNREFARRIRAGACDEDAQLRHVLWAITLQRVRESAPRYLASIARTDPGSRE